MTKSNVGCSVYDAPFIDYPNNVGVHCNGSSETAEPYITVILRRGDFRIDCFSFSHSLSF